MTPSHIEANLSLIQLTTPAVTDALVEKQNIHSDDAGDESEDSQQPVRNDSAPERIDN